MMLLQMTHGAVCYSRPGENGCRLEQLPFRHLLPHMRLGPCGLPFGSVNEVERAQAATKKQKHV